MLFHDIWAALAMSIQLPCWAVTVLIHARIYRVNEEYICNPIVKGFFFVEVCYALWRVCTKKLISNGNMISNIVIST